MASGSAPRTSADKFEYFFLVTAIQIFEDSCHISLDFPLTHMKHLHYVTWWFQLFSLFGVLFSESVSVYRCCLLDFVAPNDIIGKGVAWAKPEKSHDYLHCSGLLLSQLKFAISSVHFLLMIQPTKDHKFFPSFYFLSLCMCSRDHRTGFIFINSILWHLIWLVFLVYWVLFRFQCYDPGHQLSLPESHYLQMRQIYAILNSIYISIRYFQQESQDRLFQPATTDFFLKWSWLPFSWGPSAHGEFTSWSFCPHITFCLKDIMRSSFNYFAKILIYESSLPIK